MVNEGKAYFTKYGSVHKTIGEAEKAEKEEEREAFMDYIVHLTELNDMSANCINGRAAEFAYEHSDILLEALDKFGKINSYFKQKALNHDGSPCRYCPGSCD